MPGVDITDPRTAFKASVAALIGGQVLLTDINGNIIQDSNLFWDNTNKSLNIGGASSNKSLNVKNGINLDDGDGFGRLWSQTNSGLVLVSNTATGQIRMYAGGQLSSFLRLYILQNGNVGVGQGTPTHIFELTGSDDAAKTTTNTWTVTSDRRLKKNITSFTDGLAVLLQLNPVNFQFTGDGGMPKNGAGISLIAQDVEATIPYCIRKTKGKIKETDTNETDIYGLNNNALIYVLINAVKELDTRLKKAGL